MSADALRRRPAAMLAAGFVLLVAYYFWTVAPIAASWRLRREQPDYHNLLARSLLQGHLYVKVRPSAALLSSPNPYDPAQRAPGSWLYDASLYHGRYYLYFGPAPAVVLLIPFRLATGLELPLGLALAVFASAGCLASLILWEAIRRRYFPDAGGVSALAALLILGLCTLIPVLIRRTAMYELPIVGAYAFAMLALLGLHQALHARRGRRWWLAGAGLAMGLAVASRAIYALAAPVIFVPLAADWMNGRREGRWRWLPGVRWWLRSACALLPLAAIAALLAAYNRARFGKWTEFGMTYQLTGLHYEAKMRHFSWAYLRFDLYSYFLALPRFIPKYPFLGFPAGSPVAIPAGFGEAGLTVGALLALPICWAAAFSWGAAAGRPAAERRPLIAWLVCLWGALLAVTGALVLYYATILRYMADFMPLLMLAAAVGVLVIERWIGQTARRGLAALVRIAWLGALAYSSAYALALNLELYGILERTDPAVHAAIARALEAPADWLGGSVPGPSSGPVDMEVRFVSVEPGHREALLSDGDGPRMEHVFTQPTDDHHIVIGYCRGSAPMQFSAPIPVQPGEAHRIYVDLGTLYPPGREAALQRARRRWGIRFDGRVVLEGGYDWPAAGGERAAIAFDPDSDEYPHADWARIVRLTRPSLDDAERLAGDRTRVSFQFRLPEEGGGTAGPLLVARTRSVVLRLQGGWAGRGQPILEMTANGRFLGRAPLPADASEIPHTLSVVQPLAGGPGPIEVSCDGQRLLRVPVNGFELFDAATGLGWDPAARRVFGGFIGSLTATTAMKPAYPIGYRRLILSVRFPPDRIGDSEPLLVTGQAPAADFYVVRYQDGRHIRIGLDHWGDALLVGESAVVDFSKIHRIGFALPGFANGGAAPGRAGRGPLAIDVDGKCVLRREAPYFGFAPEDVVAGRNDIGGSACGPAFTGRILAREVEWAGR